MFFTGKTKIIDNVKLLAFYEVVTACFELEKGKHEEIIDANIKDRKERVYGDMTQGKVERRRERIGR